jgi:thermitase
MSLKLILSYLITSFLFVDYSAQCLILDKTNYISERDIYIQENTRTRYSTLIRVKLKQNISSDFLNNDLLVPENITDPSIQKILVDLRQSFGDLNIKKFVPHEIFTKPYIVNKRTQRKNKIPDWSSVYEIIFKELVPIDHIIDDLVSQSFIEYAEGPIQLCTLISPNDEEFVNSSHWAFDVIEAEEAWEITKGDSNITIAIHDKFGSNSENELHSDLLSKVDHHFGKFGNHGRCVAGVAGASTDNFKGIASLGWNLKLHYYDMTYTSLGILEAVADEVDVINLSHCTRIDHPSYRDAVKTALAAGIIVVASAGNNCSAVPEILYPAAYNFGDIGQVIAVSATRINGSEEIFADGWNYSPGDNYITDPTSAFVDVAAPGSNIMMLDPINSNGYRTGCGTSLSSAFVSALAGLLLSVNSTLAPNQIYEIITRSADKIGQYSYDENGWNRYLGFGRINAYKAVMMASETLKDNEDPLLCAKSDKTSKEFSLFQNFPNPFNPVTKIKYKISEGNIVKLEIFNLLGERITVLVDDYKPAGTYEEVFDITGIKHCVSGIYLFKLSVGEIVKIKKGILLK